MVNRSSEISGFYKLSVEERLKLLGSFSDLTQEELEVLRMQGSLNTELADKLIENVVSTFEIPVGIAPNFRINGKDYLIPMAIEEASVVAACSNAARIARASGGFVSESTEPIMIGQIQIVSYDSFEKLKNVILEHETDILKLANTRSKTLSSMGAGAKGIEIRTLEDPQRSVVVHLLIDVRDAMGANVVNSMCETVASYLEEISKVNGNQMEV